MKKKISRILGVALVVALVASLMVAVAPVSAKVLKWGSESIPTTTGKVIGPQGVDVVDLAVASDGTTMYAVTGKASLTTGGSGASVAASWSDTYAQVGDYSAMLTGGTQDGSTYAAVAMPVTQMKLTDVATFDFSYYFATAGNWGPHMCFYTHDPADGETGEITLYSGGSGGSGYTGTPAEQGWNTVNLVPATKGFAFFGSENDSGLTGGFANVYTLAEFQADSVWATHVIDRVQVEYGWWGSGDATEPAYVDDVSLNSTDYAMGAGPLMKSTDAGVSWSSLDNPSGVGSDISLVAVAPDDPDVVAIVADGNEIYIDSDGGASFSELTGLDTYITNTYCLAISQASSGVHYIAVGGDDGTNEELVYWNYSASVPKWTDTTAWDGLDGNKAVRAVGFSPAFASDKVFLAVTEYGTDLVLLEIGSVARKKWNHEAGFGDFDGTTNDIASDTAIAPLQSASIALAPTYLGADETTRKSFVALAAESDYAGTENGIYRMTDDAMKQLQSGVNNHSIAYTEGEKLVAGSYDTNTVYRCADPLATVNWTISSTSTYQKPGGEELTIVAWAGDNVVAATSGNESAFAVSEDDGKTFNDISMVDTLLTNIEDIAVSADGGVLYLLSDDGADLSLWRVASKMRLLSIKGDYGYIVRIAPEDASVVYLGEKGADTVYYSDDPDTKWVLRSCNVDVADMAVESAEVVYAVDSSGSVTKTVNAGFIWGTKKSSKVTGNMIVSLGEDKVLVGSTVGGVSYIDDGDVSTWTKIKYAIASGKAQVIASGLADGDFIYGATDVANDYIYRWEIGESTAWEEITVADAIGTDYKVYGIALEGGVLYAAASDGSDSKILRTLEPSKLTATPKWSTITSTSVFNVTPQALRLTTGSTTIWAADTEPAPNKVYSYEDTLATVGPTLISPREGAIVTTTPTLKWEKIPDVPSDVSIKYIGEVSLDSGFTDDIDSLAATTAKLFKPDDNNNNLAAGTKYYWRIRVEEPIYSAYSSLTFGTELGDVTLKAPAYGEDEALLRPTFAWIPVNEATAYEFELGTNADPDPWGYFLSDVITRKTSGNALESTVWECDRDLEYSTTYYWHVRAVGTNTESEWVAGVFTTKSKAVAPPAPVKVEQVPAPIVKVEPIIQIPPTPAATPITPAFIWAIVAIGALLVILVIVLIFRTRRVS